MYVEEQELAKIQRTTYSTATASIGILRRLIVESSLLHISEGLIVSQEIASFKVATILHSGYYYCGNMNKRSDVGQLLTIGFAILASTLAFITCEKTLFSRSIFLTCSLFYPAYASHKTLDSKDIGLDN
uniref:Uncharacterized protein n=1 Tax=Glossina brevipalpis TaxID=37001 RepID=A0A1A9W0I2_9MUSC